MKSLTSSWVATSQRYAARTGASFARKCSLSCKWSLRLPNCSFRLAKQVHQLSTTLITRATSWHTSPRCSWSCPQAWCSSLRLGVWLPNATYFQRYWSSPTGLFPAEKGQSGNYFALSSTRSDYCCWQASFKLKNWHLSGVSHLASCHLCASQKSTSYLSSSLVRQHVSFGSHHQLTMVLIAYRLNSGSSSPLVTASTCSFKFKSLQLI